MTVSQTLFFVAMEALRDRGQVVCRMSLHWDLSDVFVRTRLKLCVLGRKNTGLEMTVPSHYVKRTQNQHDLSPG